MKTDAKEIKEMEVGKERLQHRWRAFGMNRQRKLKAIRRQYQFMLMQRFEEILGKIAPPQQSQEVVLGQMAIFKEDTQNLGICILNEREKFISFGQQGTLQALHQFGGEVALL
jgi:hypothetical protein